VKVPFLDLKAQYAAIKSEMDRAIAEVVTDAAFAGGPYVAKFETSFAAFCRCQHAIGVGSGTDALWFALLALGVGAGDEVITVPNTFIATAEAISFCGAKPVFVDVDERTYTMRPDLFERAITAQTKVVIPVHLFGQPADMDPILRIAAAHGLRVIEDACQAHGAEYHGRPVGSLGDAGCFSFYPGKNLGAYGEAGAVITNNQPLAEKIRILRDHGQPRKYFHTVVGWNGRMDGIQGAVLAAKLPHLPAWNEARRAHARLYKELLSGVSGVTLPWEADYSRHVFHIFALRLPGRDAALQRLTNEGIGCAIHYPIPLHLQEAYRDLAYRAGAFPVAERCAGEFLSLPMFPELQAAQVEFVVGRLRAIM